MGELVHTLNSLLLSAVGIRIPLLPIGPPVGVEAGVLLILLVNSRWWSSTGEWIERRRDLAWRKVLSPTLGLALDGRPL
jgi:hypothetical protein